MRARRLLTIGLFLCSTGALGAQSINVDALRCLPREQNGVVHATTDGSTAGQPLRLYFRWDDLQDFYWVPMEMEPGGRWLAFGVT